MAGYFNAGQDCTAATRVLVAAEVHDDFVAALTTRALATKTGGPDDTSADYGPLNSASQLDRVAGFIDRLPSHATVHSGGERVGDKGYFYSATVVSGVRQQDEIQHVSRLGHVRRAPYVSPAIETQERRRSLIDRHEEGQRSDNCPGLDEGYGNGVNRLRRVGVARQLLVLLEDVLGVAAHLRAFVAIGVERPVGVLRLGLAAAAAATSAAAAIAAALALHTLEISHYLITVLVSLRPDFFGRPALAFSGIGPWPVSMSKTLNVPRLPPGSSSSKRPWEPPRPSGPACAPRGTPLPEADDLGGDVF